MKLKWGICGAGNISNDFCHALRTLPAEEHEIVAIASRSDGKASSYAEKFSIRKSYSKYEDLAADSEIDLVYIATWTASHIPLTKMMLNAGKHVVCEAPIGYNSDEVKEVFELAKQKKLFLMEAFWSRAFEIYDDIRKTIDRGDIGEVKLVTSNFCYTVNLKGLEQEDGSMFQLGIFNVQFVNWIFNNEKPESMKVLASITEKGVDEDGCIIMSYKNGAMASITSSLKCDAVNSASVFGTKGHIVIPDYFWWPEEAIFPSGKRTYPLSPVDESVYIFPNSHGLWKGASLVRCCIMKGLTECPVMSHEDSLATHGIVDDALQQTGLKFDTAKILMLRGGI